MTVLLIGFGAMGSALASRLRDQGTSVLGVDPFVAAAGSTQIDGIRVVDNLAAAATELEAAPSEILIFVRLADQVADVLTTLEKHTIFDRVPAAILSTLAPTDAVSLVSKFGAARPLAEAPVSGGVSGARDGTLTVMVSGPVGEWIEDAASTVFRFAEPGQPAAAKLLNNALGAANANALASLLSHAENYGLSAKQMLAVVRTSSGGSWMATHFDDFPVDLLWKDFTLIHADRPLSFPPLTIDDNLVETITIAREQKAL